MTGQGDPGSVWFGPGHLAPRCSEDVPSTQLEARVPQRGRGEGGVQNAEEAEHRQRPLVSFPGKPGAGVWRARGSWGRGGASVTPGACWGLSSAGASAGRILQKDEGLNMLLNIPDSAKVVAFKPEHPGLWSIKVGPGLPVCGERRHPLLPAWPGEPGVLGSQGWRWLGTRPPRVSQGSARGGGFTLHRGSGVV